MHELKSARETVQWYHHAAALPIKLLSAANIGPFGGENAISAVIEAVLLRKKGITPSFSLSKTDTFFMNMLTKQTIPDAMIEYRELNHEAQQQIIERWGKKKMGVIWIGAGVFTLEHPLLAARKPADWHIWTDKLPKIVNEAQQTFNEIRQRSTDVGLSYTLTLPEEVDVLNRCINLIAAGLEHICIFSYGVTYALTVQENFQWLSKLRRPNNVDMSFVFNAPGSQLGLMPGMMAAFHNQRMQYYQRENIESLFDATIPGSRIVWEKPREQTRNKIWGTWIVHAPAQPY